MLMKSEYRTKAREFVYRHLGWGQKCVVMHVCQDQIEGFSYAMVEDPIESRKVVVRFSHSDPLWVDLFEWKK